ncbi:hypothetical protein AB4Z21_05660 [Paenibacillus sp. MCAF20]
MSTTLAGDLVSLIGTEVTIVTNASGQLSVIGTLVSVGNDFLLVTFDDGKFRYELRVFYANIVYVQAAPTVISS